MLNRGAYTEQAGHPRGNKDIGRWIGRKIWRKKHNHVRTKLWFEEMYYR